MSLYHGFFRGVEVPVTQEELAALCNGSGFVVTARHAPVEKIKALREGRANIGWNPKQSPGYRKEKGDGQLDISERKAEG